MSFFYTREDGAPERYLASPPTVGPWDPKLQHGGPVAALLGTRIARAAARAEARVSYFSLDFLGPVPVAAIDVTTTRERPGKKIEMWSALATAGGRPVARATAWLLATLSDRAKDVRVDEPAPPIPPTAASAYFESVPRFGYGDALEWRFAAIGPATVWSRLRVGLVEGEETTPLARVLAMVDSANGISAELDVRAYLFVPVNLTVSLARAPEGEWVGMSAVTEIASDGVGTTRARIFDPRGTIGRALQTLYVDKR